MRLSGRDKPNTAGHGVSTVLPESVLSSRKLLLCGLATALFSLGRSDSKPRRLLAEACLFCHTTAIYISATKKRYTSCVFAPLRFAAHKVYLFCFSNPNVKPLLVAELVLPCRKLRFSRIKAQTAYVFILLGYVLVSTGQCP